MSGQASLSPQDLDRLASIQTIDLTTFGRTTGQPRRIEIWWFQVDGRFLITGTPGRRDWLANVLDDPNVIVHVGGLDLETTATLITDHDFRMRVFTQSATSWYSSQAQLDHLVGEAPMIELHLG